MRWRSVAIFFGGFAAGVVFVGLLWGLTGTRAIRVSAAPPLPPIQVAPVPLPNTENPPVTVAPPLSIPPATEQSSQLMIPVQGVSAGDLHDDFNEARGGHLHQAIDIMAPRGTPVVAADEGNVVKLFSSKPGGLTVYQFDDSRTYCYYYAHLERYAPGLREGTLLRKGDVLGYVGTSGDAPANSPHLHFAMYQLGPEKHWWEGTAIDPYPYLAPR